jgi:hypothetical protein
LYFHYQSNEYFINLMHGSFEQTVMCCLACFGTSGIFVMMPPPETPRFGHVLLCVCFDTLCVRLGHFCPTWFVPKSFLYCRPESGRMNFMYSPVPLWSRLSDCVQGKSVFPLPSWVALQPSQQPGPILHRILGTCSPKI